jgi:hypothetical protein
MDAKTFWVRAGREGERVQGQGSLTGNPAVILVLFSLSVTHVLPRKEMKRQRGYGMNRNPFI